MLCPWGHVNGQDGRGHILLSTRDTRSWCSQAGSRGPCQEPGGATREAWPAQGTLGTGLHFPILPSGATAWSRVAGPFWFAVGCHRWPQPLHPAATLPSLAYRNGHLLVPPPAAPFSPSHSSRPDVEAACGGRRGAARVVWAVGGPATGEGASDEGLWCPCLACWGAGLGVGGTAFQVHQSPGTGKAGFPLTVISRGDRLLEG